MAGLPDQPLSIPHIHTKLWTISPTDSNDIIQSQLIEAAQLLQSNHLIAFPTETVYGLGGNAYNDGALSSIFIAKGRPNDNPLIVHVHSMEQFKSLIQPINGILLSPLIERLCQNFWPGPLTFIVPAKLEVSSIARAGLNTVAVRMPSHPVALALLRQCNIPLAAPSANLSGHPSPVTAQHVLHDLSGRIAGIIDGGVAGVGLESTVIECHEDSPYLVTILRPGGITISMLESVVGVGRVRIDPGLVAHLSHMSPEMGCELDTTLETTPKAPGMKYAHYAPQAPLYLVYGTSQFLGTLVDTSVRDGKRVGILTTTDHVSDYSMLKQLYGERIHVAVCGTRSEPDTVAHHLYSVLREFDTVGVDVIYSETFSCDGIGDAIMNRLGKAAAKKEIRES